MLISESYREQNAKAHKDPDWGTTGWRWAELVHQLAAAHNTVDILDYGCGKQTLKEALLKRDLRLDVTCYDPSFPELAKSPGKHDIVACIDVMEHVESKCVDDVLKDLRRCCGRGLFMLVSTVPAIKLLPDGRNAHVTVKPYDWWLPKIMEHFTIMEFQNHGGEFMVVAA